MSYYTYLTQEKPSVEQIEKLTDIINTKLDTLMTLEKKELVFLLLGKTGHGKSSLGNTLLKRDAFEVGDNFTSVTKFLTKHSDRDDQLVVFDTIGPFDARTDEDNKCDFKITVQQFTDILHGCQNGINVIILVFNYSTKFTQEENQTLQLYKDILGEDFVRTNGIIAVTHGNNFHIDEKRSFKEWCEKQSGLFNKIYHECNKRAVLLDNKDLEEKKLEYRKEILDLSKNITKPYTKHHFQENRDRRKEAGFRWEVDELKRKFNHKIRVLEAEITKNGGLTKQLKLRVAVLIEDIKDCNNENEDYNLKYEYDAAVKLLDRSSCCIH